MLSTQIQYLNWLEQRRHNEAMEQEQYRSNRAQEYRSLRSIKATELKNAADIKLKAQELANQRWNMERQNEVNRRNAETNRINAINQQRRNFNDWNLGLQANRIAEQNSQWNRGNLLAREFENTISAQTLEMKQAQTQADIAVNWFNAQTNARNAETKARQVQVTQEHYRWADTASLINATANVANAIFRGVGTLPDVANVGFTMGRMGV